MEYNAAFGAALTSNTHMERVLNTQPKSIQSSEAGVSEKVRGDGGAWSARPWTSEVRIREGLRSLCCIVSTDGNK
jgi:hypothetical protein